MKQIMDGCTAAAWVAYALSDIATIYPITPVASMGDTADKWCLAGRRNVFGTPMQVREMESELGAAGATHGALCGGALATTFTASQGLLLMIPNMFKISSELLPAVFHVGARSLATQALSIYGDHQDVMACRTTGFAMLASASVQETMDLALVAHLAAIERRVPVLHFFDGFRTSNELSTIEVIPYDTISQLVDRDAVAVFRRRAMNPEHPDTRGSAQDPDVYFQNREAANKFYDAFPALVQKAMDRVGEATGRTYHLFDYFGAPDATEVVIAMGSSTQVLRDVVETLNAQGRKVGCVVVRLFRPFSADALLSVIPESVRTIAVLDRTKEPGAQAEPLLLDVMAAVQESGRTIRVIGGRYGLSSKDFDPAMAVAVFDNAAAEKPLRRFTVGINDDVTHLSLPVGASPVEIADDVRQCLFYGIGADGTVGATRQAAAIISAEDSLYAQVYFSYSAKKSGGYTICNLRYAPHPIRAEYSIEQADYVACNKTGYVTRFDVTGRCKPGGIFVLNSPWTAAEMEKQLPAAMRRQIARKGLKFYNIDATAIAAKVGLGQRVGVIMEAVFFTIFKATGDTAATIDALKGLVKKTYMHEGGDVVARNLQTIDMVAQAVTEIAVPAAWADAAESAPQASAAGDTPLERFVAKVARPCMALKGDTLPVSVFTPDGVMPAGTTAWEKRCIAIDVPEWEPDKCVQCTMCSVVCSHAAIRPVMMTAEEKGAAPDGFTSLPCHWHAAKGMFYRIQVYAADCTGCGSCAVVCPGHALTMKPLATQLDEQERLLAYAQTIPCKESLMPDTSFPATQLRQPLMEFSGACGGCGETPYVKMLTQLFGDSLVIANATGCSSIWGANFPSNAYCVNSRGHGPAWGNSLFEDNAEYGFGIASAFVHRREALKAVAEAALASAATPAPVADALKAWLEAYADTTASIAASQALVAAVKAAPNEAYNALADNADMLAKKSVWAIGGDGWAYDIGFAGLDHVLAQNIDINLLVMDTECYSNTGGQTSKATPLGAVMKYAAHGKRTAKKDLGRMMMTYGNVYVAQIALGANMQQTVDAMREAEAYPGPSIVIAYCPCINHGIRSGMSHSITEEREAVKAGYWQIYRYNPQLEAQGRNPLTMDMAAPDTDAVLNTFLAGEDRYADLTMVDPAEAPALRARLRTRLRTIYGDLTYDAARRPAASPSSEDNAAKTTPAQAH